MPDTEPAAIAPFAPAFPVSTMFIRDPSGHAIGRKAFANMACLVAN